MFKAVLFDLDQTLVDFLVTKHRACDAAIRAMVKAGLKMEPAKAKKELSKLYGQCGWEHQLIFNKFLKKMTGKVDYKILAHGIIAYRKAKRDSVVPYPKTRETLLALKKKGLKLGIVSDAPRLNAWLRLAEMNLTDFFDVVITLGDSKRPKPHPTAFKKALRELKVKPEEALFVGDNPNRDILGAKKVGMKTCLAKHGQVFFSKKHKADFETKKISELVTIVNQQQK